MRDPDAGHRHREGQDLREQRHGGRPADPPDGIGDGAVEDVSRARRVDGGHRRHRDGADPVHGGPADRPRSVRHRHRVGTRAQRRLGRVGPVVRRRHDEIGGAEQFGEDGTGPAGVDQDRHRTIPCPPRGGHDQRRPVPVDEQHVGIVEPSRCRR
jgi:hypothetical protein